MKRALNRKRVIKLALLVVGLLAVIGLSIYGRNKWFRAATEPTIVTNRAFLSSNGQTLDSADVKIQLNDEASPTPTPTSTPTPTATPTVTPSNSIILSGAALAQFESEDGRATISLPMKAISDSNASGGKYIEVPNGAGSGGKATYPVDSASAPGNYYFWARVYWPSTDDNSFFIQVDDGTQNLFTDFNYNSWHWVKLGTTLNFSGSHTVKILQREDGSKVDKIILTTNASYNP